MFYMLKSMQDASYKEATSKLQVLLAFAFYFYFAPLSIIPYQVLIKNQLFTIRIHCFMMPLRGGH